MRCVAVMHQQPILSWLSERLCYASLAIQWFDLALLPWYFGAVYGLPFASCLCAGSLHASQEKAFKYIHRLGNGVAFYEYHLTRVELMFQGVAMSFYSTPILSQSPSSLAKIAVAVGFSSTALFVSVVAVLQMLVLDLPSCVAHGSLGVVRRAASEETGNGGSVEGSQKGGA